MSAYALKRLLLLVPVLLGVSLVVFGVMSLVPGDPALAILGPYATPERLAELRAELGLDRSWPVRYGIWLGGVLDGDLGRSVSLERPVLDVVLERLGPTLLLSGTALLLGTLLGLVAGMVAALRHNQLTDRLVTLGVLLGISIPSFWLGLLLILVFAVWLGWLPVSGMTQVWSETGGLLTAADVAWHLVLPSLSLALVAGGVIGRLTRGAAIDVLASAPIRMARARGVPERRVAGACAEIGVGADGAGDRAAGRVRDRRRGLHRDHLPMAGARPALGRGHRRARPAAGAGWGAGAGGGLCAGQSGRGSDAACAGSAHPGGLMIAAAMIMVYAKPSDTLDAHCCDRLCDRLCKRLQDSIFGWFCALPCAHSQPGSQTWCRSEQAL